MYSESGGGGGGGRQPRRRGTSLAAELDRRLAGDEYLGDIIDCLAIHGVHGPGCI